MVVLILTLKNMIITIKFKKITYSIYFYLHFILWQKTLIYGYLFLKCFHVVQIAENISTIHSFSMDIGYVSKSWLIEWYINWNILNSAPAPTLSFRCFKTTLKMNHHYNRNNKILNLYYLYMCFWWKKGILVFKEINYSLN